MTNGLLPLSARRFGVALVMCLVIAGCSSTSSQHPADTASQSAGNALINSLDIKPIEVTPTTLTPGALDSVRDGYAALVDQIDDEALSRQINLRLADVEMLLAEEELVNGSQGSDGKDTYQRAVDAYQKVLTHFGDDVSRAEILYQLSRAYDLQGKRQESAVLLGELLEVQPDSMHASEAWFRQGEAYFSDGDYASAAEAYGKVLNTQGRDNFYIMAAYMQGWSFYKLEEHQNALKAFDTMLSVSFAHQADAGGDFAYSLPVIDELSKGQQKLVRDSLRVMAGLFASQGNGEAVTDFYQSQGERSHSYLVYNELAQQHLDNDRYLDAADAYLAFASTHSSHAEAVSFYVKHIDAFILGDFPSEIMAAKAGFINTFGLVNGNYQAVSLVNREQANPYLYQYLRELAQAQHSLAQQLADPARRSALPPAMQALSELALQSESAKAFESAANYYLEFIDTFPDDENRPQVQFDLAESYYQSGQFAKAIAQYEDFAYRYSTHPRAADGAYTSLLAYKSLLPEVAEQDRAAWQVQQRDSRDKFITAFTRDSRVIAVVQTLMQEQFDNREFNDALYYSAWLLKPPPEVTVEPSASLVESAQRVSAHSYFGLENYPQAEVEYAAIITNMADKNPDYAGLMRNYAVSIYRQAEQAAAQQHLAEAVEHLQRIINKAPTVDVRVNAQYDAATYLLTLARFTEAQNLFEDFLSRFPNHELSSTIDTKLLYIFEQTEQWQRAAELYYSQWQLDKTSETGRLALLTAAEYYAKAGLRDKALPAYRTYAHTYPEPFESATEVRFIMSEFYVESGEDSKRRFWLNKLIKGHDQAGNQQTLRSQTLAAMAAMVFANDTRYAFTKLKLKQPLKISLSKKREALTKAVNAHNKVLSYGIREYATQANHQLGVLYRTLAADLMASERPGELSALELEQYDLLLEEQAYPFEEQAISVFEANAQRSWKGVYDESVKASFAQLTELLPSRYRKPELMEAINAENY